MARRKWTIAEIEEYREMHGGGFFYWNKEDSNIFVPQPYGFGFVVNWANPISWVFSFTIMGFVVLHNSK
jgi:uncharacterized membrane protein